MREDGKATTALTHKTRKRRAWSKGSQMDRDELEALMAIYGEELAHVQEDGTLAVVARSSDESKEAVLLMTAGAGYPAELPRLSVTVNRGVKNEVLLAIVKQLEREAVELQGMPMAFALAEKLKQLLDEGDGTQKMVASRNAVTIGATRSSTPSGASPS